jgi:hypothetical protein
MNKHNTVFGVVIGCSLSTVALAEGSLQHAFNEGSVNGNIRAHYNAREFETKADQAAFSLGGALRAETGPIGWAKFGLGYYTAQDLGTNNSDPAKVDGRMGSELEVLGEAYIALSGADSTLTLGRQKISSPFANPGDAFIIPVTFNGMGFSTKSFSNITLKANYLTKIKSRNSDSFIDVGEFSTARYGVDNESTDGTLILGVLYKSEGLGVQGWYYQFSDLFDTMYVQANYAFAGTETLKPFVAVQLASQSDSGDKLLGEVGSYLWGVQGGLSMGKAKVTLAYNSVGEETDAFKNGAFLAPYNFSTSPLFTNNMLQTLENVNAGEAAKLTFNYGFPNVKLKLSYATFDFKNDVPDRDEVDFDVTYALDQYEPGLSVRWRFALVTSDTESVETTGNRFQLQYAF